MGQDEASDRPLNLSGVIPVPPDWRTALKFDFVDLDDTGNWVFMEAGPDAFQMLYGTPLTGEQIDRLNRGGELLGRGSGETDGETR